MTPLHIHAEQGDVAPVVLLPGDPGRAERIAARLDSAVCYSRNRGLLGFTGNLPAPAFPPSHPSPPSSPIRLSIQTTGMGAPSTAIISEELLELGARVLVRVGTSGGARQTVRPGDLIVATASVPLDGTTAAYVGGAPYAPAASFAVARALADAADRSGATCHAGLVATDDAFYHPDPVHFSTWAARGVLAFEMEASALFTVCAIKGAHAGCLLTVSNTVGALDWLTDDDREAAIDRMIAVALDAIPALTALT
jgi:purine-nucleoside phosphorylase